MLQNGSLRGHETYRRVAEAPSSAERFDDSASGAQAGCSHAREEMVLDLEVEPSE